MESVFSGKATGHVLECVGTVNQSPLSGVYWKRPVVLQRNWKRKSILWVWFAGLERGVRARRLAQRPLVFQSVS